MDEFIKLQVVNDKTTSDAVLRQEQIFLQNAINARKPLAVDKSSLKKILQNYAVYVKKKLIIQKKAADKLYLDVNADQSSVNNAIEAVIAQSQFLILDSKPIILDGDILIPENPSSDIDTIPNYPNHTITKKDVAANVIISGDNGSIGIGMTLNIHELSRTIIEEKIAKTNIAAYFKMINIEKMLDITLMKNYVVVQPNGKIAVTLKLSQEQIASGRYFGVLYISDDGTVTNMHAVTKDGYISFETTHLSTYALISYVGEMPKWPMEAGIPMQKINTGDDIKLLNMTMLMVIAGGLLCMISKKYKQDI